MPTHARTKLLVALLALSPFVAQGEKPAAPPAARIFQTGKAWTPRTNINADMVMVYGIDPTTADRVRSWREHGYRVAVMTGVAWGRYAPYLSGKFDGKQHWDETQQAADGSLILHSGREVPYISPSESYGRYLAEGVENALDAGAEAIYLEEPEFWARAGWSASFKRSWQAYYGEPWVAPDSSPDAQYRASKLKYYLYGHALQQVFLAVRSYGRAHHRAIPCYVATHSLINYAQWDIVSPESSLLGVGADGYIAQVWTGTSRTPNEYDGALKERTFETAFLEYGALQNIARSSGKPIWYLNDPIEDNPEHSWTDYRTNWQSTLVASLLQPDVSRYELLPWPERIFGEGSTRPASEPTAANPHPDKTVIPESYATELQTVFGALGQMQQPAAAMHWDSAGTRGLGVLVSDTLMFQRAAPEASDAHLGESYGLALPLLKRGFPVEPVQIETSYKGRDNTHSLDGYKVLLLTYDGQKPPSPAFHKVLADWVRAGGALVVLDDDRDPYDAAQDWWTEKNATATPRADLFWQLGLPVNAAGLHRVGKGVVLYSGQNPASLSYAADGADMLMGMVQTAAAAIHLPLEGADALVLRRGPYVVASGLDGQNARPVTVHGDLIDLFDPLLGEQQEVTIGADTRALLLDVNKVPGDAPQVLAASGRVEAEHADAQGLSFAFSGIADTQAVLRILAPHAPTSVTVDGKPVSAESWSFSGRTILLRLANTVAPQQVRIVFS